MGYLEKWEKSVTQREGYKDLKNEQNMMLLPLETRQGIQITGIFYTNNCISIISTLCSEFFCGDCAVPFYHPRCRIILQQPIVPGQSRELFRTTAPKGEDT